MSVRQGKNGWVIADVPSNLPRDDRDKGRIPTHVAFRYDAQNHKLSIAGDFDRVDWFVAPMPGSSPDGTSRLRQGFERLAYSFERNIGTQGLDGVLNVEMRHDDSSSPLSIDDKDFVRFTAIDVQLSRRQPLGRALQSAVSELLALGVSVAADADEIHAALKTPRVGAAV